MDYKQDIKYTGGCRMTQDGCRHTHQQPLNSYDWLCDIPGNAINEKYVEIQFKNTRKGYFSNINNLELTKGDQVVVEASPGYDIGTVSLTGRLVRNAMRIHRYDFNRYGEPKPILRHATEFDLENFELARQKEHDTMIKSRRIAEELGLEMKIGDVEYQGDGTKAIFYYIADGRVDFRQLIRVLADTFHIRIEMKQIGARQESGRIGGIGSCGRQLCCSAWMTSFVSVGTVAARFQDLSLNPQKLTGQCGKLKCCINYEVDAYVEAGKKQPDKEIVLHTEAGDYYFFKADSLKRQVSYSKEKGNPLEVVTISNERAFDVIELNKSGRKPETLEFDEKQTQSKANSHDILDDSLTRFDRSKKKKNKKKRRSRNFTGEKNDVADIKSIERSQQSQKDLIQNKNEDSSEEKSNEPNRRYRNNKNEGRNRRPGNNQQRSNRNIRPKREPKEKDSFKNKDVKSSSENSNRSSEPTDSRYQNRGKSALE
ncbi:PSP1 domain-containing protein [Falsiporphyromonas endometrii]|uniref:Stage 0 sporulation family protein n=1 Tax=Falsiporphyromonas endometrii TaxID=1387297 RepID=A0ABV9K838_9PORP